MHSPLSGRGRRSSVGALVWFVAATFAALAWSSPASAQGRGTSWVPRAYIDGQLGLFGDVTVRSGDSSGTDGLEPSGGAVIGIDVPLVPVLSIAVEAGATVWNSEGGNDWEIDPSVLAHLSAIPRLRIPFGDGDAGGAHGALYLGLLLGPTLGFVSDDVRNAVSTIGGSVDMGVGLHGGAQAGAQLFFTRNVGIDIGAGYVHHVVWHRVSGPLGGGSDVQIDLGQLMIRAGLMYAF